MTKKVSKLDMPTAQEIVSDMHKIKMLCVEAQGASLRMDLVRIKGSYHSIGVDLNLFPRYIADLWIKPLTASSLEQFHTRALYFARLAEAHAIWLATNVEAD